MWQGFIRAGCSHYSLRPEHSCWFLMVWTSSTSAECCARTACCVFSGNQNQSHPGTSWAAAGPEDGAGGQTGAGAKSTDGTEEEKETDSCYLTMLQNTYKFKYRVWVGFAQIQGKKVKMWHKKVFQIWRYTFLNIAFANRNPYNIEIFLLWMIKQLSFTMIKSYLLVFYND